MKVSDTINDHATSIFNQLFNFLLILLLFSIKWQHDFIYFVFFFLIEWFEIPTSHKKFHHEMMPSTGFECDWNGWNGWNQVETSYLLVEKKKFMYIKIEFHKFIDFKRIDFVSLLVLARIHFGYKLWWFLGYAQEHNWTSQSGPKANFTNKLSTFFTDCFIARILNIMFFFIIKNESQMHANLRWRWQ